MRPRGQSDARDGNAKSEMRAETFCTNEIFEFLNTDDNVTLDGLALKLGTTIELS